MNNLINIVDLSKTSICIAVVVFIIVTAVSNFVIKMYKDESEDDSEKDKFDWKTLLYSFILGTLLSFVSLALFKYVMKDNCDILTEPFCSKINIV